MAVIDPAALAALREQLTGVAILRGEDGFADELASANTLSPLDPDLVVGAADEADVQAAVRFAKANGLEVVPMATGHGSYRVVDSGMVIRTSRLDSISVDDEHPSFTIGAGGRWMNIVPVLREHGLAAVTGSSPSVGAVGLVLGGGIGPLGRTLGWSADRAISFRVVNADGDVLVASADSHPDLFWALKGGKVGFGIVTELTLEAVRLDGVHGGGIFFAEEHIEAILRAWLPWSRTLPEEATTSIGILRLPPDVPAPLGGATVAHVRWAYVDADATDEERTERGDALLAPLLETAPVLINGVGILPTDRLGEIHAEPMDALPIWEGGEFLDDIDDGYIDAILKAAGPGVAAPFANVETRAFGGAMHREPALPNAIGGRYATFSLLIIGVDIPGVTDAALREQGPALLDSVKPYAHAEINYNWAGHPTDERWARLWSPETAAKLAEVRAQYDPDGRFAFGH